MHPLLFPEGGLCKKFILSRNVSSGTSSIETFLIKGLKGRLDFDDS